MFDVTRPDTLHSLQHWLEELRANEFVTDKHILKVLVANKADLACESREQLEASAEARSWAAQNGMLFSSLSATSAEQVHSLVEHEVVRALQSGVTSASV